MIDTLLWAAAIDTDPTLAGLPIQDVLIGSVVMPPIVAVVNQSRWPAPLKGTVALVVCLVAALLLTVLRGPVTWLDWRATALAVCGSAFAAYKLWWQPSGIAPAIEQATPFGGGTPRADTTA